MNIAYLHSDASLENEWHCYEDMIKDILGHEDTEIMTVQEFTEKFNDDQISDLGYVAPVPENIHVVVETYKDDNSVSLFSNLSDAKDRATKYCEENDGELNYGWGVEIFEDTKIN